eukprot:tig00021589_g22736.t1
MNTLPVSPPHSPQAVNTAAQAVKDAGIKTAQRVSEIGTKTVKAIDVLEVFATPEERAENAIRRIDDHFGHAKEEKRAEEERDANFQRIFNLPVAERLTTEYSCAIQKKVLLHGKLFVFKNFLGFRSTVFGDTTETMALREVTAVEKKNTALIVPNAIEITMADGAKHFLTSFLFRDEAFSLIETLWHVARGVDDAEDDEDDDDDEDEEGLSEAPRPLARAGSGARSSNPPAASATGKSIAGFFGRLRLRKPLVDEEGAREAARALVLGPESRWAGAGTVPLSAALLARSIAHVSKTGAAPLKPFVLGAVGAIDEAVQRACYDTQELVYWLAHTVTLVALLRHAAGPPPDDAPGAGPKEGFGEPLWAAIREVTGACGRAYVALARNVTFGLSGMLAECVFEQEGGEYAVLDLPSEGKAPRAEVTVRRTLLKLLGAVLQACKKGRLPGSVLRQLFHALFGFLDASLFNALLTRGGKTCSPASAFTARLNVSLILDWIRSQKNAFDLDAPAARLTRTWESLNVLILERAKLVDRDVRDSVCPHLSTLQIEQLLLSIRPDEVEEKPVPVGVLRKLNALSGQWHSSQGASVVASEDLLASPASAAGAALQVDPFALAPLSLLHVHEEIKEPKAPAAPPPGSVPPLPLLKAIFGPSCGEGWRPKREPPAEGSGVAPGRRRLAPEKLGGRAQGATWRGTDSDEGEEADGSEDGDTEEEERCGKGGRGVAAAARKRDEEESEGDDAARGRSKSKGPRRKQQRGPPELEDEEEHEDEEEEDLPSGGKRGGVGAVRGRQTPIKTPVKARARRTRAGSDEESQIVEGSESDAASRDAHRAGGGRVGSYGRSASSASGDELLPRPKTPQRGGRHTPTVGRSTPAWTPDCISAGQIATVAEHLLLFA